MTDYSIEYIEDPPSDYRLGERRPGYGGVDALVSLYTRDYDDVRSVVVSLEVRTSMPMEDPVRPVRAWDEIGREEELLAMEAHDPAIESSSGSITEQCSGMHHSAEVQITGGLYFVAFERTIANIVAATNWPPEPSQENVTIVYEINPRATSGLRNILVRVGPERLDKLRYHAVPARLVGTVPHRNRFCYDLLWHSHDSRGKNNMGQNAALQRVGFVVCM